MMTMKESMESKMKSFNCFFEKFVSLKQFNCVEINCELKNDKEIFQEVLGKLK